MAGWSTDGDDDESPLARLALLEAENGIVQARRTASIIADAVGRSEPFVLTPQMICELNLLAVKGVVLASSSCRGLEAADEAWQQGRLDVSALQALIALYLQHQLDDAPREV